MAIFMACWRACPGRLDDSHSHHAPGELFVQTDVVVPTDWGLPAVISAGDDDGEPSFQPEFCGLDQPDIPNDYRLFPQLFDLVFSAA